MAAMAVEASWGRCEVKATMRSCSAGSRTIGTAPILTEPFLELLGVGLFELGDGVRRQNVGATEEEVGFGCVDSAALASCHGMAAEELAVRKERAAWWTISLLVLPASVTSVWGRTDAAMPGRDSMMRRIGCDR